MNKSGRACPVCGTPIARGMLMCKPHWYSVPADQRAAVNRTWRAYLAMPADSARDVKLSALRAYREAAAAAETTARSKLP